MKKKLWAALVAFIALMVFATSAFAAARWRNVASISPSISAGDNNYTCEISCLSGTTKIDCRGCCTRKKSKCSSLFTVKCLQKRKNARHRPPNFQKADNSNRPF